MADSFIILTILGTIVGVYSILPVHKKLRIGYSFGELEKYIVIVLGSALILTSLVNSFVFFHCENASIIIRGVKIKLLFIIDFMQLLFALIIFGVFLSKFFKKKVKIRNKKYFIERLEELVNEQYYAPALALIDENYTNIFDSNNYLRTHVERILLDSDFVEQLIKFRPYFGLILIKDENIDNHFKKKFIDQYLKALLNDNGSILYKEIINNQNLSDSNYHRYRILKTNRLIYTLFSNINLSVRLNVWRPIGEEVINILDKQYKMERDVYNEYQENFTIYSEEIFRDPIFVAIRFFDIMVREAIYQKAERYMGLYYYSHFVERICRNYKLNEYSQPDKEFPNSYSYLLYEIISSLRNWIILIQKDTTKVQQKLEKIDCSHENGNIIKSSIICLSQSIQKIINTSTIPDKFKEYLTHIVFNLYFDLILSSEDVLRRYGEILMCCIIHQIDAYNKENTLYKQLLRKYLDTLDKPPITCRGGGIKALKALKDKLDKLR